MDEISDLHTVKEDESDDPEDSTKYVTSKNQFEVYIHNHIMTDLISKMVHEEASKLEKVKSFL